MTAKTVFSIGHSDYPIEVFVGLLAQHDITALADVRSIAGSRHLPQFAGDALRRALAGSGIAYVYLGEALGGRPGPQVALQMRGKGYAVMAATNAFQCALERIAAGAEVHRIALMCAERDPADCHRGLLVGRALAARGLAIEHIHADGSLENQRAYEARLLQLSGSQGADLFASREELLDMAYAARERTVAWSDPTELRGESK